MTQTTKQTVCSFKLEPELVKDLDRRISRMGYASRREFFAAVVCATIYGDEPKQEQPDEASLHGDSCLFEETENRIRHQLFAIIRETILPVIAMRGTDIAFQSTWKDIREIMHDQTGIWATESEIKDAYRVFTLLNKPELTLYKNDRLLPGETS